MIRCKPLLGTFVEISIDSIDDPHLLAIEKAFAAIQKVQGLMSFHHPQSELSRINAHSHLQELEIHPWTFTVLKVAQEVHQQSTGLFNCGIGHRLVAAGLLPHNPDSTRHHFGGIEDVRFISPNKIKSSKPLCLDLGGIAKGFAIDVAVDSLKADGACSGCVNAGGDLRVFGSEAKSIYIRNPERPAELLTIGHLENGAIANSGLYFAKRDKARSSHLINPINNTPLDSSDSYSVIAKQCVYADALTKVLALSNRVDHPCFAHFSAHAIRIAA